MLHDEITQGKVCKLMTKYLSDIFFPLTDYFTLTVQLLLQHKIQYYTQKKTPHLDYINRYNLFFSKIMYD